jgi:hypothetical protein
MKGAETAVLPALLAAGAGFYLFQAATAGGGRGPFLGGCGSKGRGSSGRRVQETRG